jgi:hypothetical protein
MTRDEITRLRGTWEPRARGFIGMQFEVELDLLKDSGYNTDVIDPQNWVTPLWAIWQGAGGAASDVTRRHALSMKSMSDLSLALDDAIEAVASHAGSIVDTTLEVLEGLPVSEWDAMYDSWGSYRVDLIGRSEVQQAVGWSSHETGTMYGMGYHAWRTMGDTLVRDTHQVAEMQQPVPISQPFLVGGAQLRYPGDPSGPASEVINCRCWETYI